MIKIFKEYLKNIVEIEKHGDAREESYYSSLEKMLKDFSSVLKIKNAHITVLPKKTEAGNPDFRIWDGKQHIIGYIEAKIPGTDLDKIEDSEQLKRYRDTFPNLLLTDFYEFRLYRNGKLTDKTTIARHFISSELNKVPPIEKEEQFIKLLEQFFSFSMPKLYSAKTLAEELAKRTRFLRDEIIKEEMDEKGDETLKGFYEAFKEYLIPNLTEEDFADLYAQTITYGLFASRMRSADDFSRTLAYKNIPSTIGILKDIFRYISLGDPSKQMEIIIDDIADVLSIANVNKIVEHYSVKQQEDDPIIHFYETFLSVYDPEKREKRGVYYTPRPVVSYIVRSIDILLKDIFQIKDGFANDNITLLDPAAGTLTFPIEAIKHSVNEYIEKYGDGDLQNFIKNHILKDFYAFELMMAPYAIGHLKVGFILDEFNYKMSDEERFNLYLTNTLEEGELKDSKLPGTKALSEENHLAGEVKKKKPILIVMGNPPYSGISSNMGEWIQKLIKEDISGCQSYYKIDGEPLGEKNPKWLQDDYVKFLRFAQWKIETSGKGIVGMITNHSYLDNPTFRGMRQSLTKTFNKIYILNLHGNSLKKETAPDGTKDENVFDIRQGVSIALFVKEENKKGCKVYYSDSYGLRDKKYKYLFDNDIKTTKFKEIKPQSPWYFFVPYDTEGAKKYEKFYKITDIFPVNSVGIVTARDKFVIDEDKNRLKRRIEQFRKSDLPDNIIKETYKLKDTRGWKLSKAREELSKDGNWEEYFTKILYRPFDERFIYYYENLIERSRNEVMRHMLAGDNLGLVFSRQSTKKGIIPVFITNSIIGAHSITNAVSISSMIPLYLYPESSLFDEGKGEKKPNINENLFNKLKEVYKKGISPEELLYYIYGVLYSNVYRKKYGEYLKIDFPHIPFTTDYKLFAKIAKIGKELVDLHLLKSKLLDEPIVKFMGKSGDNTIEKIKYEEKTNRVYINKEKYFEGIMPDMWNYHIGGYQVLHKYLKDRKGNLLKDVKHYIKIATAIHHTIKLQTDLDNLFSQIKTTVERE